MISAEFQRMFDADNKREAARGASSAELTRAIAFVKNRAGIVNGPEDADNPSIYTSRVQRTSEGIQQWRKIFTHIGIPAEEMSELSMTGLPDELKEFEGNILLMVENVNEAQYKRLRRSGLNESGDVEERDPETVHHECSDCGKPLTNEEQTNITAAIKLDDAILVALRETVAKLETLEAMIEEAHKNPYSNIDTALERATEAYESSDIDSGLLGNASTPLELIGEYLYAEMETPGPFIEGQPIYEVDTDAHPATEAQRDAAYDEYFHMQELWRDECHWMKGTSPDAMKVSEHLDTYLDDLEAPAVAM